MRRQSTGPASHATLCPRIQHKKEREERKSGISISNEKVSISPQTRQSVQVITQETQGRVCHTEGGREETGKRGEAMERGRESGGSQLKETAAREEVRLPPPPLIQLEVFGRIRRKGHCQRRATAPPSHPAPDTPNPTPTHPGVVSLPDQLRSALKEKKQ